MSETVDEATGEIVDDATDVALETLAGDIRDTLLTHVRSMQDPWSKLSEQKQQERIFAIESAARSLVRRAAFIIAGNGFDSIQVTLKDFAVKDGVIKGKFETVARQDTLVAVAGHANLPALIVLADAEDYMGQRAPARPDPDQPDIPLENPEGGQAGAADETDAEPPAPASEAAPAAKPKRKTTEERVAERIAAARGSTDSAHAAAGA